MATQHDVVILGGGLAGLSLAIQLRRELPGIDVLVLERRQHPVPEATHKVGESTVEIAANYFDTVLGLKQHLTERQLKKFGFRFFFSAGRDDIESALELGASRYLATPAYQLDRGIFETIDDFRDAVRDFVARYNTEWLVEKNGHLSPAAARQRWLDQNLPCAA